ncbi:MAG: hypothetical protein M3P96_08485 [Actinomycetota bacterium]|nr:hypothetical protein [Actinomycetota bacterium]
MAPGTGGAGMWGVVCRKHGGAAGQVKRKAEVRLAMAADHVTKELLRIALDPQRDDDRKLRAILAALDRAGIRPGLTVEVGAASEVSWAALLGGILVDDPLGVDPEEEAEHRRKNAEQLAAGDGRVTRGEVVKGDRRALPSAPMQVGRDAGSSASSRDPACRVAVAPP